MPPASRGEAHAARPASPDLLDSLVPTIPWLASVLSASSLALDIKDAVLNSALVRASQLGNGDTLEWLLQHAATYVNPDSTDSDGLPAIVLATSLRHGDCVRILVEAGAQIDARDPAGWTALHWATQGSDFPLAAYLLNHRASLDVRSHKGLRPIDLVRKGPAGDAMREILSYAEERLQVEANGVESPALNARAKGKAKAVEDEATRETRRRHELARDCAQHLELDMAQLGFTEGHAGPSRRNKRSSLGPASPKTSTVDDDFLWDACRLDQMMIFSENDLPALYAVIVDEAVVVPESRAAADTLYLASRYAALMGPDGLLEELLLGTMERIEVVIHTKPFDMALLAFWLSNVLTLLHYLRRDALLDPITATPTSAASDDEDDTPSLQAQLGDLINELFVFVIRDIEKRISGILEPAMLDYESLPFDDVRFEDEWRIMKAFNSVRSKRESMGPASVRSLFGGDSPTSADKAARRGQSMTNLRTPPSPSPTSHSPRTITALLSALVFVLQTYRLPSHLVLQALAQVIYWIACELVNRILTQRRHLCRSRAVQIRLNASSLEDWARINGLPTNLISRPFEPLNALLQWLQCLSSERGLPDLLRTLQSLTALNPAQLRRAVREYRYEVDEPKLRDECAVYLAQMHHDWERRHPANAADAEGDDNDSEVKMAEVAAALDDVFDEAGPGPAGYVAPEAPPCLGELLDSRYMVRTAMCTLHKALHRAQLPFALPNGRSLLLPHAGPDTFGPLGQPRTVSVPAEIAPSLPDGLFARLDAAAERLAAARAVQAHNARTLGLGLGLESPGLSASTSTVAR